MPNWSQWFNDTTKATVGQHTLKVKAKGSGYRDSKLSTAVTFNIYSVSTTLVGCTATHESRILQHTNVVIVFTAKERFTFTDTTISTAQIKIGNTAYTPTSADTYVVSTDGTTATLTINAEAVIGNIAVTVALTEKLATPTEFTVTKGLASWNSVDKATAYEFVAVDSNNVESSIGSYTPIRTLSGVWGFNDGKKTNPADAFDQAVNFKINRTSNNQRYGFFCSNNNYPIIYAYTDSAHSQLEQAMDLSDESVETWYKKIDFGTTPQIVSEIFYNWFIANATKQ